MRYRNRIYFKTFFVAAMVSGALTANAEQVRRPPRAPLPALYQQECGACHVPYAPRFLPAASWRRTITNLPNHFGTDASLDPASQKEIALWLEANAGSGKRAREAPPEDRITRAAWFVREHNEISTATWKLPAVKTPSNCAACHTQADQGDFNEHHIKVPR